MKVNIMTPYSIERNLGKAYNEAMRLIGDNDWACLIDYDVMFLTPDAGRILHEYVKCFPDAGMLTCYTNRIHPSSPQLLDGKLHDGQNITDHIITAERMRKFLYRTTELHKNVSGFLMMIRKKVWDQIQFTEELQYLGVDTDYWKKLKAAGYKILRMDGLYVFHTYRLKAGINNKAHLL